MIVAAKQEETQEEGKREPRATNGMCVRGGCPERFYAPEEACEACQRIHLERRLLKEQLKAAQRFGHTHDQRKTVSGPGYSFEDVDCALCVIEGQLDRLDEIEGLDWRAERDRMLNNMIQRSVRGGYTE